MHHRDLEAWKEAIQFVAEIYKATCNFPKEEMWGLTSQIRRASVSIPSNIAEGCARGSIKDTLRFLDIALGSIAEVETQLLIAQNLNYLNTDLLLQKLGKINALVQGIKKYLNNADKTNLTELY